ncbi:MAG: hypothetical protein ABIF17_00440 [Patescibacteria group bacterium]
MTNNLEQNLSTKENDNEKLTENEYLFNEKQQRKSIIEEAKGWKDFKEYIEKIEFRQKGNPLVDLCNNYISVLGERTPQFIKQFIDKHSSNPYVFDLIFDLKNQDPSLADQLLHNLFEKNNFEDFLDGNKSTSEIIEIILTISELSPENANKIIEKKLSKIEEYIKAEREDEETGYFDLDDELVIVSELALKLNCKNNNFARKIFDIANKERKNDIACQMAAILNADEYIREKLAQNKIYNIAKIGKILTKTNSAFAKEIIEQLYTEYSGLDKASTIAASIAKKDPNIARETMNRCQDKGTIYNGQVARIAFALKDKEILEKVINKGVIDWRKDFEEIGVEALQIYPDITEKIMLKFFEDAERGDEFGFSAESAGLLAVKLGYLKNADYAIELCLSKREPHSTDYIQKALNVTRSLGRAVIKKLNELIINNKSLSLEQKNNLLGKAIELEDEECIKSLGAILSKKEIEKLISSTPNLETIKQYLDQGRVEYKEAQIRTEYDIFEEADLNIVVPETLEEKERIKDIENQIIDINNYEGILHHTQLSNIQNMLIEGLSSRSKLNKTIKWGFFGKNEKELDRLDDQSVSITAMAGNTSFLDWDSVPWKGSGPITCLFDTNKLEKNDMANKDTDVVDKLIKFIEKSKVTQKRDEVWGPHMRLAHPKISNKAQIGMIVSPEKSELFRRKVADREEELEAGIKRIIKGGDQNIIINPLQAAHIATNKLSRLFYENNEEAHLVPLYDNKGNVLWPEKISYEDVKKIIQSKNK